MVMSEIPWVTPRYCLRHDGTVVTHYQLMNAMAGQGRASYYLSGAAAMRPVLVNRALARVLHFQYQRYFKHRLTYEEYPA